ncbi:hypothetical protein MMB20_26460, partial [Salmonella enterica]|nr:hypothetical protein [Salmonella enterica]
MNWQGELMPMLNIMQYAIFHCLGFLIVPAFSLKGRLERCSASGGAARKRAGFRYVRRGGINVPEKS